MVATGVSNGFWRRPGFQTEAEVSAGLGADHARLADSGSVLGPEAPGLRVFAPSGHPFRFPAWSVDRVVQPWSVRRGIYGGVRRGR